MQTVGPVPTFAEPPATSDDPQVGGLDANNADERNPYGWFAGGRSWWGDFGDPFIVVQDGRYLAFGSSMGARYLPILTSSDLSTWFARDRWSAERPPWSGGPDPLQDPAIPAEIRESGLRENPGDLWNLNDGLVKPAAWGLEESKGTWIRRTIWAPSVARFGSTWNLYYAVRISRTSDDRNGDGRFCISMATSRNVTGPYRDNSTGPIICDDDPAGSIDPEVFTDPATGTSHLLWKAAGKVGSYPSSLNSIELDDAGRPLAGARAVKLLETAETTWEGETIENPSMVYWQDRYFLMYSGNAWRADDRGASRYATGWAECPQGAAAACVRGSSEPLLASDGPEQGPGGASFFMAPGNRLFIAYAAFTLGEDRNPRPRRLKIAELGIDGAGLLKVRPK